MKIGILTLQLHTNYGGILQAYALQTVLERMGHEVVVLNKRHHLLLPIWKWPYSYPKRIIQKYILGRGGRVFFESYYNRTYPIVSQNTELFIDKYIHRLKVEDLFVLKEDDFDAFVVGSDQVWRPMFYPGKIENAYLDFAKDWDIKRIAYAASFGTSKWEYTKKQTRLCGELLRKFDLISVREESGIGLCHKHFGVKANHVLDPTMLLSTKDYMYLVEKANVKKSKGSLLCYILDEKKSKINLISKLADDMGLIPFHVNSRVEVQNAPLAERIQPPVEQWLRGFMDARMVVTDSFHACVFAIIFNKPFIVIANKERGLARIESLLAMFGLQKALYDCNNKDFDVNNIDWNTINDRLLDLQNYSLDLLKESSCGMLMSPKEI